MFYNTNWLQLLQFTYEISPTLSLVIFSTSVKLLDWGEEGHRTDAEIASLRAAFTQEVAVWHKLDHPNVTKVTFYLFILIAFRFL